MRLTKLPHWVMTDKFPAFYDSESATAIEQTAKVYGAMQELIEDYNKFVEEIDVIIDDFISSTNQNIEVFTTQMEQKFHDFVKVIELKITEQDQKIDESIIYIKNNLAKYIVDNVEATMKELISAGNLNEELEAAFDTIIEKYNNIVLETVNTYKAETDQTIEDFKAEVNNKVNNVSAKGFYSIKLPLGTLVIGNELQYNNEITDSTCLTELKYLIEKIKTDEIDKPYIIIENNGENATPKELRLSNMYTSILEDGSYSYGLDGEFDIQLPTLGEEIESGVVSYEGYTEKTYAHLDIIGSWNNEVFTPTGVVIALLKTDVVSRKYVEENGGSNNTGIVYMETSQNLNGDQNFSTTLKTDLNNVLIDYFANNNENPVLIVKGTTNSVTCVFTPTSDNRFISISGNLSEGYIERRIDCTFQYTDGVKNVKSVNYFYKNRGILFKDNTTSFTPTSDYHPATKKYVDDTATSKVNDALVGTTSTGTFTVESGDVTDGASATWKTTQIGKMVVLDIDVTIPTGNDVSGCYFKTTSLTPIPNGVYGTILNDVRVAVSNTNGAGTCEIIGFNTSITNYQPRLQLIYWVD